MIRWLNRNCDTLLHFPPSSSSKANIPSSSLLKNKHRYKALFDSKSGTHLNFYQNITPKKMHTFYEILQTPNNEGETTIVFFANGKRYVNHQLVV